jgi:uncharacterized protein (TIGR02391 family)
MAARRHGVSRVHRCLARKTLSAKGMRRTAKYGWVRTRPCSRCSPIRSCLADRRWRRAAPAADIHRIASPRTANPASCAGYAPTHTSAMLAIEVQRRLTEVISASMRVAAAAEARAPSSEVELLVSAARRSIAELRSLTGVSDGHLGRHLAFIQRNHREGRPQASDGDVADIRERDLIDLIEAVSRWIEKINSTEVTEAAGQAWARQDYDGAVRAAFVRLETRMRELAGVPATDGSFVGRRLVNRLLPENGITDRWTPEGLLGQLKEQEQAAARELFLGAFGLFRNATGHRETGYTREEATDVLSLVALCFRLLDKMSAGR